MKSLPILLFAAGSLLAADISAQAQTTRVIFLGRASTGGADPAIQAYLEGRFGVANVTYQDTEPSGTVTASTILGFDVAVLSSTPDSSRYRSILDNSPTPIVNMENAVADDGSGEFKITKGKDQETEVLHSIIITAAHPITAGFGVGSSVPLTTWGGTRIWWSENAQAPGAASLAHDDDDTSQMYLTYIEKDGVLLGGGKAPARQVMFGMTDFSFNGFSPEGKQLFGQAVFWAAGGTCLATTGKYGTGLAGKNGIPTLITHFPPVMGTTMNRRAMGICRPASGL